MSWGLAGHSEFVKWRRANQPENDVGAVKIAKRVGQTQRQWETGGCYSLVTSQLTAVP